MYVSNDGVIAVARFADPGGENEIDRVTLVKRENTNFDEKAVEIFNGVQSLKMNNLYF